MLFAFYIKNKALSDNPRLLLLRKNLEEAGCVLYDIESRGDLRQGTEAVISVGGDGTFLSASKRVADSGIPIIGVNMGRLGFLSENKPEDVAEALVKGEYRLENRTMLSASISGTDVDGKIDFWPYALNEVTVHRSGAAVLGISVCVDGEELPTYWADGLIVATSSGSTAYSLSAGGPICTPDSKVLIIAPIAPHNLNVRPLVVPETAEIEISIRSRDASAIFTMDNRTMTIGISARIRVSMAQFSLKRIRLSRSSFVKALVSKLFWGEDIRNNGD
ncbi:MAG: NAD(+)/NADH kinase [Candidatus Cryptobacteroides sp.]|nr:NAD(+)/NADH kinase [Bacteroidales bacterium]MDY3963138.1 NAD(+)/NADH kinase [Candidatus Cryptobacteroides sp.]